MKVKELCGTKGEKKRKRQVRSGGTKAADRSKKGCPTGKGWGGKGKKFMGKKTLTPQGKKNERRKGKGRTNANRRHRDQKFQEEGA